MRKLLFTLSVLLFFVIVARAQAPAFINYQGVARNAVGNAMVNHPIRLKLTIRDGGALGIVVYSETRQLTTNTFGLFNVQIGGAGATNVIGSIGSANWYTGTKWLQVEIDPEGGTTFKDIGTTQLISVPYSLYTNQSGDIVLPFSKSQGEDVPLFKLINTNNNASSLAYEGLSSSTANNATAIRGILTSVNPGAFSAAVTGQNNGTGANGIGVFGNQNGSGWGVYGTTPGGIGVYGNSNTGTGVYGLSAMGASVYGFKDINGQGNVGLFRNTSTINFSPAVSVQSNGPGDGINMSMTGLGNAGVFNINNGANFNQVLAVSGNGTGKTASFQNSNAANSSNVVEITSNGTGKVGVLQNTNNANASNVLDVSTNGTGRVGYFQNTGATNNSNVVEVTTNGTGKTALLQNTNAANASNVLEVQSNGTGKVGVLQNTNVANASNVLDVTTNGTGKVGVLSNTNAANASNVLDVATNGTGRTGQFQNTNAANAAANVSILSNGTGDNLQSTMTGTGKAAVVTVNNASNASNVMEVSTNGTGKVEVLSNTNAANASNVLDVATNGTGRTGQFQNTNAANAAANVSILSNGTGDNLQSTMTGTGKGAVVTINNAANASNALEVSTNGTGKASSFTINNAANANFAVDATSNGTNNTVNVTNTGTGRAGFFQVNNAASTADALSTTTNGTGASWGLRSTSTGTNGAGLFIQSNAANTANNLQSNQAGLGRAALFNATNAANTANAMEVSNAGLGRAALFTSSNAASTANAMEVNNAGSGNALRITTSGTGYAANFTSTNATPKALQTSGAIQLTGIGEGVNKILMTDVSGNANWNSLASVGGVSGTGTLNYVSKWTPNGTFVGVSQIFDDATNVGINTNTPRAKLHVQGDFIDSATTTGFAVTIINNNNGDGDGLKIKLGRAKSVYSPPSVGSFLSPTQVSNIRDLIRCDGPDKLTALGNIVADGALEDLKVIAGLAVGTGNIIIDQINDLLSAISPLPWKIGPYSTPAIHIWNATTIFPGVDNSGIISDIDDALLGVLDNDWYDDFNIPALTIPALDIPSVPLIPEITVFPEIPNIDLTSIGVTAIDPFDISFWDVPSIGFCLSDAPGSSPMNNNNEFIRFTDKNDAQMGSIRAVSVTNWATNYLNPAFMYKLYGAITSSKADKLHAKYHFKNEISAALKDYATLGVEYASGNGDYAEWLERKDTKELISAGDIVAVKGGRITKDLEFAEQVMVVSHNPIVLGNVPKEGKTYAGNNIAFMGQVPVKVMGPVSTGDYIVGQKTTPGYGIAKHPNEMTIEDFKFAVGRSWVEDLTDGPKMVNTVVGVHNGDYMRILKGFETKFTEAESRLKTLESKVDALINAGPSTKKPF